MKRLNIKKRSDYNYEMDEKILDIFEKRTVATIERIRKDYNKKYGKTITWDTIKTHLIYLTELGKIKLIDEIKGKKIKRIYGVISSKKWK